MVVPLPAVLYFDHNATHPLSAVAREAWLEATERFIGNPSSPHRLGSRAEAALDQARERLAGWLGCAAAQIIWTSGATESCNAALAHAGRASDGELWVSSIEHPCVMEAASRYFTGRHRPLHLTTEGVLDVEILAEGMKKSQPGLIAVMAANNETGVIQPWREVLALCREHGVPFFCDAAQWVGKLPAAGLGEAEFVSGCAHKFGGPVGVGFLKVPARFQPLIVGGPQEDGRRAGTENVAGILSMIAALAERETQMKDAVATGVRAEWKRDFEGELLAALPGSAIVGSPADRLWNTVSAVMPELPDCRQRWVVKLDKLGLAVSTGSACASGKEKISHVLEAMGMAPAQASRVLRFSSGWETSGEDWRRLLDGLRQAHAELAG